MIYFTGVPSNDARETPLSVTIILIHTYTAQDFRFNPESFKAKLMATLRLGPTVDSSGRAST